MGVDARGPIFIVGTQGAGTTLLRLMLDSHEHIAIPQETGFMRAYNAHRWIPFKWSGRDWAKRLGWSREELDEELARFYDRLFMRYVEAQGKRRWGDKTPFHTFHIDNLVRLFGDCMFIGIIRHPAGSVASNMSRFGHTYNRASLQYLRYNSEIARQAVARPDRFAILRYEDLVLDPEPVMRPLLEWLGEPWSDKVLSHHEVQSSRGGRLTVEGLNRRDDPIDASRIGKWQTALDARTLRRIGRELGPLGEFYGYSMDEPAPVEPLRADGAPVIGGADIDARIDRFPALDLRTPVEVPNAERLYSPAHFGLRAVSRAPGHLRERTPARARTRTLRRAAAPLVRRLPPQVRRRLRAVAGG